MTEYRVDASRNKTRVMVIFRKKILFSLRRGTTPRDLDYSILTRVSFRKIQFSFTIGVFRSPPRPAKIFKFIWNKTFFFFAATRTKRKNDFTSEKMHSCGKIIENEIYGKSASDCGTVLKYMIRI